MKCQVDLALRGRGWTRCRSHGRTRWYATPAARHLARTCRLLRNWPPACRRRQQKPPGRPAPPHPLHRGALLAGQYGVDFWTEPAEPFTLIISERPIWATPVRNEGQQAGNQHLRLKPAVGFWIPRTDSRHHERQTAGERLRYDDTAISRLEPRPQPVLPVGLGLGDVLPTGRREELLTEWYLGLCCCTPPWSPTLSSLGPQAARLGASATAPAPRGVTGTVVSPRRPASGPRTPRTTSCRRRPCRVRR